MSAKIETGSTVQCAHINKAEVVSFLPNSRTLVIIRDTDRGAGYDYNTEKYVGIRKPGGWMRGENYGYGHEQTRHINQLTLIQ